MDIQVHKRTNQIKKVSRCLFMILSVVKYLLYLVWIAWLYILIYAKNGALTVGGYDVFIENISLELKYFILCLFAVALVLYIRVATNFRELMKYFMEGDVFNIQAISCVQTALKNGIMLFALAIAQECLFWYLASANMSNFDFSLVTEIFVAVIFFGLMYTLLWTLEIGCDLNEESEMTI